MLSRLKTRSEFRKSGGLVKMNSGEIDKRTLILDTEWDSPEDLEPSESEDEGEDEDRLDFYDDDGDDEDEGDEDEESDDEEGEDNDEEQEESESENEPSPPPPKRKRSADLLKESAAPPKKRVVFGLQKPAKVVGRSSGSAPPKSNFKKPTLVPKKRR